MCFPTQKIAVLHFPASRSDSSVVSSWSMQRSAAIPGNRSWQTLSTKSKLLAFISNPKFFWVWIELAVRYQALKFYPCGRAMRLHANLFGCAY